MQSNIGRRYEPGLSKNQTLVSLLREFQEKPDSLAFIPLAEEYRKQGYPQQALEILREGSDFHPNLVNALMVEARVLSDLKRYAEALIKTAEILRQSPEHVRALQLRADIFLRLGQRKPAMQALRQIVYLFPQDRETQSRLVELEALEAPRPQISESKTSLLAAPTRPRGELADFSVGALTDIKKDWEEGVPEEEPQALVEESFATRTIAELYLRQGLQGKALQVIRKILERDPQNAWAKDALRELSPNTTFPKDSNKVVLDRRNALQKKAQFLERALAQVQLSAGTGRKH